MANWLIQHRRMKIRIWCCNFRNSALTLVSEVLQLLHPQRPKDRGFHGWGGKVGEGTKRKNWSGINAKKNAWIMAPHRHIFGRCGVHRLCIQVEHFGNMGCVHRSNFRPHVRRFGWETSQSRRFMPQDLRRLTTDWSLRQANVWSATSYTCVLCTPESSGLLLCEGL